MVQTIVSGVVQEIRSSVGQGSGTSTNPAEPVRVPKMALNADQCKESNAPLDSESRRDRKNGSPTRSRSSSPTKRKSVSQERSLFESGTTGDGLAVLLKACEILDNDGQSELSTPRGDHLYSGSPRKAPRSPAKSPRKGIRSTSPSKTRPQGPCTNPHCLNPTESPQWRRGPSEAPVLCNACGTRWIRNKSLVPIVPQRGIRYNKPGCRNHQKTNVKQEDDTELDMDELARNVTKISQSKSNEVTLHDQKKSVFKLIASVPS